MVSKDNQVLIAEAIKRLPEIAEQVKIMYDNLIQAGLSPRYARAICRTYIDPAMGGKEV
jgi:hypothetical protein